MLRSLRLSTRFVLCPRRARISSPCSLVHFDKAHVVHDLEESISKRVEKVKVALKEGKFDDHGHAVSTKRPVMFTALFVASSLVVGAIATNLETEKWQKRVVFDPNPKIHDHLTWMKTSYSLQMYNQWWKDSTVQLVKLEEFLAEQGGRVATEFRGEVKLISRHIIIWWQHLLEGQQICRQIAIGMVAIHLMHSIPVMSRIATRYFTHDVTSGRVLTLLTGQLGHSGWLHLGSNVIKLISVGELTWFSLRNKQTREGSRLHEALSGYHFIAFYLAAGTVASLTSHLFLTRMQLPRLIEALKKTKAGAENVAQQVVNTSGSSGAISANMAICALEWTNPDPSHLSFPATDMTMGPVLLCFAIIDAIGLRRGWRRMDYAAHLGGITFGSAYYFLGPGTWDWLRRVTDWRAYYLTDISNVQE